MLLVEDEDVVRSFAVRALKRQGYEVLEACDRRRGARASMETDKDRVDIVVSDVVMPEMDGPTLLKELRKRKPDIKIIFVSGYPDDAFRKAWPKRAVRLPRQALLAAAARRQGERGHHRDLRLGVRRALRVAWTPGLRY